MGKTIWRIIRTLLFLFIGLMNTVFINPDLSGTIQNYIGYALLVLAAADIISMIYDRIKTKEDDQDMKPDANDHNQID